MKKIYKAKWIFTCSTYDNMPRHNSLSYEILEDYAIVVQNEKIVQVTPQEKLTEIENSTAKDFGNAIITPSFVNLFADLKYSSNENIPVESVQSGLKKIALDTKCKILKLEKYSQSVIKSVNLYKRYACLEKKQKYKILQDGIKKLILSGTTCFSTTVDDEKSFETINRTPAIKLCFHEISSDSDKRRLQTFKDFIKTLEFRQNHKSDDTILGVMPMPIYMTDKKIWKLLSKYCKVRRIPLMANYMETQEERLWLKTNDTIGIMNKMYGKNELIPFESNLSPAEYLKDCLGEHIILANCLEVTPEELQELALQGVRFAYSPRACDKFFQKRQSFETVLKIFEKKFGFSTYSLAHNYDNSVLGELKYINFKKHLDISEALKYITIYPAKILGLDKKIGTLESDKLANFNVFKLNYNENFASILNKDNPQYVYFKGKLLVANGNILN